ncbi:MAG TPA: class I SAM-dependent methyltransferase [Thermoanaerobaculia bacterium]|nr:class I SAM-dependent methyltransferase [Thermoanaerobaculia bacterium]
MSNVLAQIRKQVWTGHNIPLTPTESTLGPNVPLITDDARTITIKALLRRLAKPRLRVLDLGSLEGGLSLEMAREGWDTLGIEGRRSNFEKAELIRRHHALDNLRFEHRDVKSLDPARDGVFDAILCCGLLYHLDNPFAFLETMHSLLASDGLLFLDTHVAPDEHAARYGTHAAQLSDETTLEHRGHAYEGRWFSEPSEGTVLDQQWSAVSNARSFWPARRALIRGVYHAGFHAISELFGMFEIDLEFALREKFSRLYLDCRGER